MARKVYIIAALALTMIFIGAVCLYYFMPFVSPGTYITADAVPESEILRGNNEPGPELRLAAGEKVNINTADAETLQMLPGIGPVLAQAIVEHRNANGYFDSTERIKEVSGIGDARYEAIRDYITVE